MKSLRTPICLSLCLLMTLSACSKNDKKDLPVVEVDKLPTDGDMSPDVSDQSPDSGSTDASKDMVSDMSKGVSTQCDANCSKSSTAIRFGDKSFDFDRSFFGLFAPSASSTGKLSVYIEAYVGGDEGCPNQQSATPSKTLILTGLPAKLTQKTWTQADGLGAKLLDFEGNLLGKDTLFVDAKSVSVTPVSAKICETCLGNATEDKEQFVALDVALSFEQGNINGRLYATHCPSFDVAQ